MGTMYSHAGREHLMGRRCGVSKSTFSRELSCLSLKPARLSTFGMLGPSVGAYLKENDRIDGAYQSVYPI